MARKPVAWGTEKDAAAAAPPSAVADPASSERAEAPAEEPERARGPGWGEGEPEGPSPRAVAAVLLRSAWVRPLVLWAPPAILAVVVGLAWLDMRGVAAPQVRTPESNVLVTEIVLAPGDTRTLEAVCRDYDLPVRQCAASAACANVAAPGAGPRTIRLVLTRGAAGC